MKIQKIVGLAAAAVALVALRVGPSLGDGGVQAGRGVAELDLGASRAAALRDMGQPGDHYALPQGIAADEWGGGGGGQPRYRRNAALTISPSR